MIYGVIPAGVEPATSASDGLPIGSA